VRAEELRYSLKETPFRPIRLHLVNGRTAEIRHPEMGIVSRSLVAVGEAGKGGVAASILHFNLPHIVGIEPIDGERRTRRISRSQRGKRG